MSPTNSKPLRPGDRAPKLCGSGIPFRWQVPLHETDETSRDRPIEIDFRTAQAIQAVRGTASLRNERRPFHTPEGRLRDVSPSTPQDRTASDDADVIRSRNTR